MRTCVVLQPGYLPWLGFFEQMAQADEFVLLDDVQYDKHGWRNRNRVKGPAGPVWLTVPVRAGGLDRPRICDVEIDATQRRWAAKHLGTLRACYTGAPHFDRLYPQMEALLRHNWRLLVELDIALLALLCERLALRRPIHRSSTLGVAGDRCARLVEICRGIGCDRYYSGGAARDYLDVALFERAGIEVAFQDYGHPQYPQRHGSFIPQLSIVDLLFNCGPASLGILTGREPSLAPSGAKQSGADQSEADQSEADQSGADQSRDREGATAS